MRRTALILTSLSFGTLLLAAPFWEKKDFSQWTADDAKKILSNSPWAKTVQLNLGKTAMRMPAQSPLVLASNETPALALEPPADSADPGRAYLVAPDPNGTGFGQMTGGQTSGGQPSGQRPSSGGAPGSMGQNPGETPQGGAAQQPSVPQGTPVVVEWESAVPVRLAELKLKTGGGQPSQADVEQAQKPADSYVVALVGVPGKAQENDKEMAAAATITPKDKQAIQATNVKEQQLDNGTRAIIFTFPKSQPITDDDKAVQFKLAKGPLPTEVKENFKLKDMHYKGQLAL